MRTARKTEAAALTLYSPRVMVLRPIYLLLGFQSGSQEAIYEEAIAPMGTQYYEFIMKMQESLLSQALPEDKERHAKARKNTVSWLSEAVTDLVAEIKPAIVLEIGAHGAEFSRDVKSRLPDCRVIAFEANPVVYDKYKDDVASDGVEYRFECIADENRTYKFSVPGTDRPKASMGSVLNYQPVETFSTYDVEGRRLDDVLGEPTGPNAMWIDVEGAVGLVLGGASKSLENCSLLFVELEATGRWDGQLLDVDVIKILAHFGLVPVLRDIQRDKWQHNVLFLKEEILTNPMVHEICTRYVNRSLGIVSLKAEIANLVRKKERDAAERATLRKQAAEQATLRKQHEKQLADRAREIATLTRLAAKHQADLQQLRNSTSWRITEPLRKVARLARRR